MVLQRLQHRVERGELEADPLQRAAALRLDRLAGELAAAPLPRPPSGAGGGGGLLGFLGRAREPAAVAAPKGVYLHGGVGRGKSMLMDLFFAEAAAGPKRRVHFHEFMLEVQARLHALRRDGDVEDPLRPLAGELAGEARLLCFDEFHVVDIADAMILGRLFEGLFERGVVVVATSNWPPRRLYENGLNRDRFLPFVDLLLTKVDAVALDGPVDYRLRHLRELPVYHHPLGAEAAAALERAFALLGDGEPPRAEEIAVGANRRLAVPRAAGRAAWFGFADLCARALGAADYLALTERYGALLLADVPLLTPDKRNEARRFMTLVDALYERRVMLFVSAAAAPEDLYASGDGAFEFRRTASRLAEMRSPAYLKACRERRPDELPKTFAPFALTSDLV